MRLPWVPRSLRSRLLAFLILPMSILVVINLIWASQFIERSTGEAFDERLRYMAESVARYSPLSCEDFVSGAIEDMFASQSRDDLSCKIVDAEGQLVDGDPAVPEGVESVRSENAIQLYDDQLHGDAVRVVSLTHYVDLPDYSGWLTVMVSYTTRGIQALRGNILMRDVLSGVLQIAIISLTLFVAVSIGLRPLKRLEEAVQTRDSQDLSPIETNNLPSELRGVTQELNNLLSRLSRHVAITKRFVENAAHQLRTPIAALLPQTELALREIKEQRARALVSKVQVNARKIARLSGQLLSMTQAESIGISNQRLSTINLADITQRNVELFRDRYPDAKIRTELESAPVKGIEFFVGEIIENLLDNARKYGGDGVRVAVRTGMDDGPVGYLEVADDGPGVSSAERSNVTERFYRVAEDNTGTGLGLAIVKEIMVGHGGELVLSNGPQGRGLKVRCSFQANGC